MTPGSRAHPGERRARRGRPRGRAERRRGAAADAGRAADASGLDARELERAAVAAAGDVGADSG